MLNRLKAFVPTDLYPALLIFDGVKGDLVDLCITIGGFSLGTILFMILFNC